MSTVAEVQSEFVDQIATVSDELAAWARDEFRAGRSVDSVKQQVRRVMNSVTPRLATAEPIRDDASRTETEFNLNWARENPELFVQSVESFQNKTPITDWKHYVDLSRKSFMTLIAVRRDKPFETVTDYVMADEHLYLRETGYDV